MNLIDLAQFCSIKGINLIGTGDFTHPKWLNELKEGLQDINKNGLYGLSHNIKNPTLFILSGEVCTVFNHKNNVKRIHHVILTPSIEDAELLNDKLSKYGNLNTDGRPILNLNPPHLTEIVLESSNRNVIFPAHAWTPWYGMFGSKSGFNDFEECYQDKTDKIYALETGLSSDPLMNWRLSKLDKLKLLSNSDSHSAWPWRIGREANVFDLDEPSYKKIFEAIKNKESNDFKFTIETNPAYGKYHWSGHRKCGISMPAKKAIAHGNVCPICRKEFTLGVDQRVEKLADRESGYRPLDPIDFIYLLPLSEIIAHTLRIENLGHAKIWQIYNRLIEKFGNEYSVLLNAKKREISQIADVEIAETIIGIRNNNVKVIPGYDGVYGEPLFDGEEIEKPDLPKPKVEQKSLGDF
jgi:uncharacterized protein (TIGR00375 family)